jgi:hypothetical protein
MAADPPAELNGADPLEVSGAESGQALIKKSLGAIGWRPAA